MNRTDRRCGLRRGRAAGGREPGSGQDPADRSGAESIAKAEELTLDAPVSPPWVLPGQPPDQLANLLWDRRAPRGTRIGPLFLTMRQCQESRVPGVTIRCSRRCPAMRHPETRPVPTAAIREAPG